MQASKLAMGYLMGLQNIIFAHQAKVIMYIYQSKMHQKHLPVDALQEALCGLAIFQLLIMYMQLLVQSKLGKMLVMTMMDFISFQLMGLDITTLAMLTLSQLLQLGATIAMIFLIAGVFHFVGSMGSR